MTLRWCSQDEWDWDTTSDRIARELDRAFAERRAMYGDHVPGGARQTVLPMCPKPGHRYGLVDGLCGVCKQEALSERGQRPGTGVKGSNESAPRSESAYGEEAA